MHIPLSDGMYRFISAFFDKRNIIYISAMLISIIYARNIYSYSFLLLFILNISSELKKLTRIFTENGKIIALVVILCIFMVYFYSIVCFFYFQTLFVEQEEANSYGSSLFLSFTSNLNLGLRFSSITEVMINPPIEDAAMYWANYIYGFSHFIFINVIIINILFGIIIDAFGKMRQEKNDLEDRIKNSCFMCGLQKKDFELKKQNWRTHIKEDHYMYNYMAFRIMLHEVQQEDMLHTLDKISLKVWKMMENSNYNFVPLKRAKALESG